MLYLSKLPILLCLIMTVCVSMTVCFPSFIVNVPYVIILSVSICIYKFFTCLDIRCTFVFISSLLVWISINTFKTKKGTLTDDFTEVTIKKYP